MPTPNPHWTDGKGRRLLEQRALRSSRRLRRFDTNGVLHVQITEALMELRRRLRLPR